MISIRRYLLDIYRHGGLQPALCIRWRVEQEVGIVRGREGQEVAWVRPRALRDYPMPPADEPLVALLQDLL